ncbi:MAG: YciI family protein [Terriglobales bacterium]
MRYLFLIYSTETGQPISADDEIRLSEQHRALMQEAKGNGIFLGAEPLQATSTATTVRRQGAKVAVIDGPFAETKEQLAGYYLLECRDREEALAWAARIPTGCAGREGCVEVRPLRVLSVGSSSK